MSSVIALGALESSLFAPLPSDQYRARGELCLAPFYTLCMSKTASELREGRNRNGEGLAWKVGR